MQSLWNQITQVVGAFIPNLVGALIILVIGLIIAWVLALVTRAILRRTTLDDRIARWISGEEDQEKPMDVEDGVGKAVFWLVMLFVLLAFFQALGLTIVTQPLNRLLVEIFAYVPRLIGAGVLLLLAWIIASAVRWLTVRGLGALNLDKRLGDSAGVEEERMPVTKSIGEALYWLVFLLFLPAVLTALNLQGLLGPVQDMVNKVLDFLPNLFAAGLLLLVGWFVAKLVQRIVPAGGRRRRPSQRASGAQIGHRRAKPVGPHRAAHLHPDPHPGCHRLP
jgi:prepilin signal peptidase PulO-like enzyme (type II secretory pathway)